MGSLLKWQVVSFISRGAAMALGIVQSAVIVRILSVSEYGLVNIAVAVGGAFGIYQHLGLASGSTREISATDDDTEIFKIFITSVAIRYFVTIPLAIALFLLSDNLAAVQYGEPSLAIPLKLFSLVLLVQGFQGIFNSVISGMHRFKQLFLYQVAIAFVSVFIYIPLIYLYRVNGFFFSLLAFNIIGSISLGIIALKPLKGRIIWPTKDDFVRLLKDILSISLGIYIVKIIYTYWQKSGPLLLGLYVDPIDVGIFSFALLYGNKLMAFSDAVTAVNLPVLSKKFSQNIEEFKELFLSNFDKVFAFLIFAAASAIYWVREVFFLFVGSDKYDASLAYIKPLVYAFIFYAIVNIIKSSIIVPAKMVKQMIVSYAIMLAATVAFFYTANSLVASFGPLSSMAYGMVFGVFWGLLYLLISTFRNFKFSFITSKHILIFAFGSVLSFSTFTDFNLYKVVAYLTFSLLYVGILFKLEVMTKDNISFILSRIKRRNK